MECDGETAQERFDEEESVETILMEDSEADTMQEREDCEERETIEERVQEIVLQEGLMENDDAECMF